MALIAVGDPGRDRTVYATILLLVALGFALIMLAAWLLRSTRPDPEVLAPLERMGERKWRRADPVWQRRRLDEVRPGGADPLEPTSAPPATDAEFERGPQPIGFDDLVASSTTTAAAGSSLPAPSAEALPVDGPIGRGGDDVVAGGGEEAEVEGDEVEVKADANAGGGSDDDDEDITGEQDTDDFLVVLDPAEHADPGVIPQAGPGVVRADSGVAHGAGPDIDEDDESD